MEQQNNAQPLQQFDMVKIEGEGKDIHVFAKDYDQAKEWFEKNILEPKVDVDTLQPEMGEDSEVFISRIDRIEPIPIIFQEKAHSAQDIFEKGYCTDTKSYVFSVVDLKTQRLSVMATTENEAFEKVRQQLETKDIPVINERQVISCNEDKVVTVNGSSYDIKTEEDLINEFRKRFPDGMTVTMEDESFSNLMNYTKYLNPDNEEELTLLDGMVEAGDRQMAGANGLLKTELRLTPDNYDVLMACGNTYWSKELCDIGMEEGIEATVLLNEETELEGVRIQVMLAPDVLENMYIEGHPYREVMKFIEEHMNNFIIKKEWGISEDETLKNHFDREFLKSLPDWKIELARGYVRPTIHKMWVEKVGPTYAEEKKMYDQTYEQAAKEFGYKDIQEFKRDFEWGKNPSEQIAEKINNVVKRHSELWKPYRQKSQKEEARYDYKKNALVREFVDNFDKKAKEIVSNVRVFQRMDGEWAVRCKVNGRQMSGRTLDKNEAKTIENHSYPKDFLSGITQRLFKDEIVANMNPANSRTRNR